MKINKIVKTVFFGAVAVISASFISCSKKTETKSAETYREIIEEDTSKEVTGTMDIVNNSISDDFKAIADDTADLLDTLGTSFNSISNTAIDSVSSAIDTLSNLDTYTNALDNVKDSLGSMATSAKDSASSVTESATAKITDTISSAADSFKIDEETQSALDSLKALSGKLGF